MDSEGILSVLADDLFLSEINLAGTHDSATAFVAFEKLARCQELSFAQQLEIGVRLLDIRLYQKDGRFYLVHGRADCFTDAGKREKLTFESVLADCRAFLQAHPRETLVMSVKQDRGDASDNFFPPFYDAFIRPNPNLWYTEASVPTLAACRGKIVLMRRCRCTEDFRTSNPCGLDFSVWEEQNSRRQTAPFHTAPTKTATATVQDCYRLAPQTKWEACAKPFLETCAPSETQICIHFLSTCGGMGVPQKNADVVNALFSAYDLTPARPYGWFFLDFPTRALCEKIMQSNLPTPANGEGAL